MYKNYIKHKCRRGKNEKVKKGDYWVNNIKY